MLLFAVTTSPAVEKTLSADTLVPGMHKYLFANLERRGNVPLWRCHQSKGSSERGTDGDLQYKSISSSAQASTVLLCTAGSLTSLKAGPSKLTSSDEALLLGGEGPAESDTSSTDSNTSLVLELPVPPGTSSASVLRLLSYCV